jgi:Glycosyl hydrolase family 26
MNSVPGANFVFDWTVNQYWQPIALDEWYPGDSVVDIIGIDAYDSGVYGPALSPQQRWDKLYNEPDGLAAVASFAEQHGKPLSIPEWGLVPTGSAGGANDDPTYMRGLATFIDTHNVEYESYFYQPALPGLVYLPQAPGSLKVYIDDFNKGVNLQTAAP